MSKMEDFLKSSLIETLYEDRFDEFESLIIKEFKEKCRNGDIDPEQELIDLIAENVKEEEKNSQIRKKLNHLEKVMYDDMETSLKRAYKLGFSDGYYFKREIENLKEE